MYNYDYSGRIERYRKLMHNEGVSLSFFSPGSDMFYLSGVKIDTYERLTLLAIGQDTVSLIVPRLEVPRVEDGYVQRGEILDWPDGEDPYVIARSLLPRDGKISVSGGMRVADFLRLAGDIETSRILISDYILSRLRRKKDELEIRNIAKAVDISERALEDTLNELSPGMSEAAAAAKLKENFSSLGSREAFSTIVSFGKNSASPHHEPSSDALKEGDAVLFDFGAAYMGYASDTTRTFFLGKAPSEFRSIYEAVKEAQQAAIDRAVPGATYSDVDKAAREVIARAGYGKYFIHRTGHGLGIDVHEPPYVVSGNEERVEDGHVFTIEPGIYIPGKGGVRIEDTVYIDGGICKTFNKFRKEIMVL
ncbi:MAG: Xaa-Pro peptidase family protein [Thermoplasmataceae archaeon]